MRDINNSVEENNVLLALATRLAAELGADWRHYSRGELLPRSHFVRNSEIILFVKLRWNDHDRVEISGSYGDNNELAQFKPYNEHMPEISVARSRPIADIAREVQRRLLPGVEALTAKCKASQKAHLEREARKQVNQDLILRAIDGDAKVTQYNNHGYGVYSREMDIEARISETTVDLKIENLTPHSAAALIQWIKSYRVCPKEQESELEEVRR